MKNLIAVLVVAGTFAPPAGALMGLPDGSYVPGGLIAYYESDGVAETVDSRDLQRARDEELARLMARFQATKLEIAAIAGAEQACEWAREASVYTASWIGGIPLFSGSLVDAHARRKRIVEPALSALAESCGFTAPPVGSLVVF